MLKCSQTLEGKISIVHRAKANSVMTVRSNLREKLDSRYIDLRKVLVPNLLMTLVSLYVE